MSSIDLKIVVLGSAFVGKTSIINRYCNGTFLEETLSTIGAGFFTHTMMCEGSEVTAMLWDTAGEERFRSVAPSLLRGANGLVLVFDLTQPESFNDIETYMEMFLDTCKVEPGMSMPVLLFGNKCDLPNRAITKENINDWMKKNKVTHYHDCSAKTGEGIEESFQTFIESLVTPETNIGNTPIKIEVNSKPKNSGGCC